MEGVLCALPSLFIVEYEKYEAKVVVDSSMCSSNDSGRSGCFGILGYISLSFLNGLSL